MSSEPDKLLNSLVVTALTIFLVVVALLTALLLRQYWLQQQIVTLADDVQFNLENLEETTDDIQRELSEIRATPGGEQSGESWAEISQSLEGVDQQLDTLGEDLSEVAQAIESPPDMSLPLVPAAAQVDPLQDPVDQVFTIFAILIALASILIAVLLALALRVHESLRHETN